MNIVRSQYHLLDKVAVLYNYQVIFAILYKFLKPHMDYIKS